MTKILIVTSKADLHADHLTRKLEERGASFVRFNSDEWMTKLSLVYSQNEGHSVWLKSGGSITPLFSAAEISAVWYRKPTMTKYDLSTCPPASAFAARESEAYLRDLCACMGQARWVNHPEVNRIADNKLAQLRLARQLGFRTPATLVTNDPAEVEQFMHSVAPRRVVYKTLSHLFISETADSFRSVYTSIVEMTPRVAQAIPLAPCLFQEYVEKAYELRVTVVGEQVFAAKLLSQEHASRTVDWRRDQHKSELRQELTVLDPRTERLCISLVRKLGLIFGAIDLIVTPEGENVFLEVNPNGQWLWVETLLGADISGALIDELANFTQD